MSTVDNIQIIQDIIPKYPDINLIKYNENITDVSFHFIIQDLIIKVITDFNKYCFAESSKDISTFNLAMVFKEKQPDIILSEITKLVTPEKDIINITDPFHIFQKIEEFSKYEIDYKILENKLIKLADNKVITNKIPKELLLTQKQIGQLLLNEIKQFNRNKSYDHYIVPDYDNPFSLTIRLKFNKESEISKIFEEIKSKFGYDYMELKLNIDSKMHPYVPPKLEYIKPKVKLSLLLSLINLDILNIGNWSSTITLEYLITSLVNQLEIIGKDYILLETQTNDLEYNLIKLASITKEISYDKVKINIPIPKQTSDTVISNDKYWKSGTGYGREGNKVWDITSYIQEQELQIVEITNLLATINKLITSDIVLILDSVLPTYIINQLKGLTTLEFNKNKSLYLEICHILSNLADKNLPQLFINDISVNIKNIYEEFDILFKSSSDTLNDEDYLQFYCLADYYVSKYIEPIKELIISSDIKEKYCHIMKKLQFDTFEIPPYHRFLTNLGKKPEQKAVMRILSEISSFKTNLPLNWESSIWVRVPKGSFNVFTFLISGPKDTPYENGLFEFHASFPEDYPNSPPKVLIHTTGNGNVRFNPNLYACGKVCLSLLGTWSGQEGEKWNSKTSTFLQVLVSIQSLILVEQPFFNEPGYERDIGTIKGISLSNEYNENRQPATIQHAMIDMIKNPPKGFEEIVKHHFAMKKEEIINKTLKWEQESKTYKQNISDNRKKLIELLDFL